MVECGGRQLPTSASILTVALVALSYLGAFVHSTPTVAFPINSQLPPVARINEPFSFVFSPQTVKAQAAVNYALARAPSWISLISDKRLLSGTPPGDAVPIGLVVGVPIIIRATDASGSVQLNSTLVVARTPAPVINITLADQIANLGPFSAPDTLLLYEQKNFTFSFDSHTFRSLGQWGLTYYAVNGDNAPLPSWVNFDANTLTFSGKAPTFTLATQLPQKFNLKLIATDVVGFSAVVIPFSLVVSSHRLTSSQPLVQLNATRGERFEYDDFLSLIRLDDRNLELTEVASVTPRGLPKWLTFDDQSWKMSGTPGVNATASNFSVSVVDTYTNTLNVTFHVKLGENMFKGSLPPLNLTAGSAFDYQLNPFLVDPGDTALSVQSKSDVTWIKVDQEALSISGTVPTTLGARAGEPLDLSIIATSKRAGTSQSQDLSVNVTNTIATIPTSQTSTSPSSPTSSSTPTETTGASAPVVASGEEPKTYLWLLLPILLIIFVGAIVLFFWFRRRQLRRQQRILKSEVSAPLPGTWMHHGPGYESGSETRRILGSHHEKAMSTQSPAQTQHAWTQRPSPPQAHQRSPISPPPMSALRPRRAVSQRPQHQPIIIDRLQVHRPTQPLVGSDGQPLSGSDSALDGSEDIWHASPASHGNHTNVRSGTGSRHMMDNISLLSDTTIGEADMQALKDRSATSGGVAVLPSMSVSPEGSRGARSGVISMLEVPPAHQNHPQYTQHHQQSEQRPLSIQPTPKMAYELPSLKPAAAAANKYEFESDDDIDDAGDHNSAVKYRRKDLPGNSGAGGSGERRASVRSTIGSRWSSAWRRGGTISTSGQQHQKKTSDAASSVQTQISNLTTAVAEHTATTATNMASPVMVNIPSRSPNPRKQLLDQDQAGEIAPLFSSGSLNIGKTRQSPNGSLPPRQHPSTGDRETPVNLATMKDLTGPPTNILSSHGPLKPYSGNSSQDRPARDAIVNYTRNEPKNAMGIVIPPLRSRNSSGRPKSPPPRPSSLQSISEVAMSDSFGTSNAARAGSPLDANSIGMALSGGSGWTSASPQSPPMLEDYRNVSVSGQRLPPAGLSHIKSRSTGSISSPSSSSNLATRIASSAIPMPSIAATVPPKIGHGGQQPTGTRACSNSVTVPAGLKDQAHGLGSQEPTTRYQSMTSRPSQKTVESSEGLWEDVEDDDDDDDAWEDIRPPGSLRASAWETYGGDSNGSFLVYI